VSKFEEVLLMNAGITEKVNGAMFEMAEEDMSPEKQLRTADSDHLGFSGEYFTTTPDKESLGFSEKKDSASKQVYIEYMSND
jgi:hypothetical protein